jgi:hypothetical protein
VVGVGQHLLEGEPRLRDPPGERESSTYQKLSMVKVPSWPSSPSGDSEGSQRYTRVSLTSLSS